MRALFVILLILLILTGCGESSETGPQPKPLDVATALGGEQVEGFERADTVRQFHFPADHGPHPDFRNEWWYFTGNLDDEEGNRYGFQLTFFRIAISPSEPERESDWSTRQVYMAHFAITDVSEKRFHGFERFSRGAVGLAGAELDPLHVWIEDWEMTGRTGNEFPWGLRATSDDTALSLSVEPLKNIVLQGEEGLSRKSQQSGNASYYYSITKLAASGTITVKGTEHSVDGTAWLDREWGTSSLGENQIGWDWFALQLNDGSDLMYYQIRQKDGSADPNSQGMIVDAEGKVSHLRATDVELEALEAWESLAGA